MASPPDFDYLKRRVITLLSLAKEAHNAYKPNSFHNRDYKRLFQQYRSAGLAFLEEAYGQQHNYYEDFKRNVGISATYDRIAESEAVLLAVQSELNDRTSNAQTLPAPQEQTELAQAAAVLEAGNKAMAAIMLGILVEKQLEHLCAQHGVAVLPGERRTEPEAEERNRELARAGVYSRAKQQQVSAWLHLRTSAAHGKLTELGEPEVTRMLAGVRDFLTIAPPAPTPTSPAPAPDEELVKLRRILRNARQRYRQLKEILAAEDIPDAKKVKKIRFVVNLLLPTKEQENKKASV